MGVAVNSLMEGELESRLQGIKGIKYYRGNQHYPLHHGHQHLRSAVADLLQRQLCPSIEMDPENVVVLNGVAACLDALGHVLCDPGDVLITPTPVYARIFSDFRERGLVDVRPVDLSQMDSTGKSFNFLPELLEVRIKDLSQEGKKVKGVVLVHPHNPLGDFYSNDQLQHILQVCAKHKLHVVVNEIYALSVFKKEEEFVSTLALDPVPDPQRLHFVWGLSKDFGLAGFRIGAVYSSNKDVVKCLKNISIFYSSSSVIQDTCASFLSDKDWSDSFLRENRKRLGESYFFASQQLEKIGFRVREGHSGVFVWANARSFLPEVTRKAETDLFNEFFDNGVYVIPGSEFYCINPGWFRVIHAIDRQDLKIGLEKLKEVVDKRSK